MPPAGWNGFPSGCQGNLWSTPPPLQLRRPPCGCTALELNSQRAHKRTGNRITRIVTRTEKFSVRVYRPSARDAYTSSESWTPHCCERPCWIRYSAFLPAFPVFLHGFRRWWTDECGSRVSLLLIECLSEFLKVYSNEESCNFFYLKEGILRFQRIFRSREWRFYRGVEAGRGLLIVYESDSDGSTHIEREIFRYLLLAGSRVFASSRGNHMATQRLPKNDGIMADCSCLRPGKPVP